MTARRKPKPAPNRSGSQERPQVNANIKMLPAELAQIDAEALATGEPSRVAYLRTALSVYRHARKRNAALTLATCWQCGSGVRAGDDCSACGAA